MRSADERVPSLDWSAAAAAVIPLGESSANFQWYKFVHFDPETGDYVEDVPMTTLELPDYFWTDSSHSGFVAYTPLSPSLRREMS